MGPVLTQLEQAPHTLFVSPTLLDTFLPRNEGNPNQNAPIHQQMPKLQHSHPLFGA